MAKLDTFIRASDRVVEFHAYFSSVPHDEHSIHSLEVHKDEIVHLWATLRTSYDELLANATVLAEEVSLETVKNKFFVAYSAHIKCLSKANELLDTLKNHATENVGSPLQAVTRINLPPCDMDIFSGDYDSWPTFRDQFSALYGEQNHIPSVEKLCHLLKKTKGEAHDIVRSCPFTNAGFQMAWQNLIDRYENKRVLINAQLKTLFGLTHIYKESGPSIKTLQRTINNCVTNLSLLDIETDNWDVIFIYICSTCLPDVTLHLWEQSLRNSIDLPTWKEMDMFLTSRFHTLESVSDIRSNYPSQNTSKKNQQGKSDNRESRKVNSFHTNVEVKKSSKCSLCPEIHSLRLCPMFLRMSVDERFVIVKNQKRCTNCLATSHEFKKCKSQYVCSVCKQKHHSLLHRPLDSVPHSSSQSSPSPLNQASVGVSSSATPFSQILDKPTTSAEAARIRQSYSTRLQSTPSHSILLGTALVNINVGDLSYRPCI